MKNKKKYLILLAIIVSIIVLFLSVEIFINLKFDKDKLKKYFTEITFKELNKEIFFDDLEFENFGHFKLKNFKMSFSNDFNNNDSLISCEDVLLKFDLFKIFSGELSLKSILFSNGEIKVLKQYGKNHKEIIDNILLFKDKIISLENVNKKNFLIKLNNIDIKYSETFKNSKKSIQFTKLKSNILFSEKKIKYKVFSKIGNSHFEKEKSYVNLNGVFNTLTSKWDLQGNVKNLDLTIMRYFLKGYNISNFNPVGNLSLKIKVFGKSTDFIQMNSSIESLNFSLQTLDKESHMLIYNSSLNLDTKVNLDLKNRVIEFEKLNLKNDSLSFNSNGFYNFAKDKESFSLKFKLKEANLKEVSGYFIPKLGIQYGGRLKLNGDIDIDFANKKVNKINIFAKLKDFNLSVRSKKSTKNIFKKLNSTIDISKENISLNLLANSELFDFDGKLESKIKSWFPIISESELTLKSNKFSFITIRDGIVSLLDSIYKEAYIDYKRGYDEIYFRQKDIGKFLINNDLNLSYQCDKIFFENEAKLNNLKMSLNLKKGILNLNLDELDGYDAKYFFKFDANFNRDFATFETNSFVRNFDLKSFFNDLNQNYYIDSKLNINLNYKLTAYRVYQIMQNSRGRVDFKLTKGRLKNISFMNDLQAYFNQNDFDANFSKIDFSSINGSFTQAGDNFYFKGLNFKSKLLTFSGYGRYHYNYGINMNLNTSFRDKENHYKKLYLKAFGALLNPCIRINKRDAERYCF